MATKYIIGSVVGAFALAYAFDSAISDRKLFGGSSPKTVKDEVWWEETDRKAKVWPRTAGPPVALNPITRQNYTILKARSEA
ncbi:hypothetical protein AAG906_032824 [Vitis piasezkii]